MFEFIGLMLSTYLLTWTGLIALLVVGIVFEHRGDRACAVFTGLVTMVVSYLFFDIPLETIMYASIGYLLIGVVWSFWRYRVLVDYVVAQIKALPKNANEHIRERMIERLAPTENLDKITAWIIIWPFSAIENILGDVIKMVQVLVTDVFKGVYHKIYKSRIDALLESKQD